MKVFVYKTDIESPQQLHQVGELLNIHSRIYSWSVDVENKDRVLRVEADDSMHDEAIFTLVHAGGFRCEVLPV